MLLNFNHIFSLLVLVQQTTVYAVNPPRQPHFPIYKGRKQLTFDNTIVNSELYYSPSPDVAWVKGFDEGDYVEQVGNRDVVRVNIATKSSTVVIQGSKVPAGYRLFKVNPSLSTILFRRTTPKRYPLQGSFIVYDVAKSTAEPLSPNNPDDVIAAVLSDVGGLVAFQRNNNIHVRDATGTVEQITQDGSDTIAHGSAAWVGWGSASLMQFSPNGTFLWFPTTDASKVGKFPIVFNTMNENRGVDNPPRPYARLDNSIYPITGTPRHQLSFGLFNTESRKLKTIQGSEIGNADRIGDSFWAGDGDSLKFYFVTADRTQTVAQTTAIDCASGKFEVIRQRQSPKDGWVELYSDAAYVGKLGGNNTHEYYYVDLSDESGWRHIYIRSLDGKQQFQITNGNWEVAGIRHVDAKSGVVYFAASKQHSTSLHLYSVDLVTKKVTALVNEDAAYYSAQFSPNAKYYILKYQGPDVPYEELFEVGQKKPVRTIVDNAELYARLQQYELPSINIFDLPHPDGYTLTVQQILPPNFNPNKKYPVLFNPYGGPDSQTVTHKFPEYYWIEYVASSPDLNYIVYIVENRGTSGKGRKFRSAVYKQLGEVESADQIWAAKTLLAKNSYIDKNHVGIWGSSFGGYLAGKVVERDSGIFTFAIMTAPVTDWNFYQTTYTEVYMHLPSENAEGYAKSAIRKLDGFKNIKGGVAITHGSGDTNVHVQHTKVLLDRLVESGLCPNKLHFMEFTDSNHNINYNGASIFHFRYLAERLRQELDREDNDTPEWCSAAPESSSREGSRMMGFGIDRELGHRGDGLRIAQDNNMIQALGGEFVGQF